MSPLSRLLGAFLILLQGPVTAACLGASTAGPASHGRAWVPQDSVRLRHFVSNPGSWHPPGWVNAPEPGHRPVIFSPDGRYFFFVHFRGEPAGDQIVYTMEIFRTRDVADALGRDVPGRAPDRPPVERWAELEFRSSRSDPFGSAAIFQPRWEAPETILFLAMSPAGSRRVYRFEVDRRRLTPLTPDGHDVIAGALPSYSVTGSAAAYTIELREPRPPLASYPASSVSGGQLEALFTPWSPRWQSYVVRPGRDPVLFLSRGPDGGSLFGPWISPTGERAVAVFAPDPGKPPAHWLGYEHRPERGYSFMEVNMKTGQVRTLLDAPAGTVASAGRDKPVPFDAVWAPDGSSVLLFNTALPLDRSRPERKRMSYVVSYSFGNRSWEVVQPLASSRGRSIERIEGLDGGRIARLVSADAAGKTRLAHEYRHDGRRWVAGAVKPVEPMAAGDPLPVRLVQSPDMEPAIIASDGTKQVRLTDPDPALVGVARVSPEPIAWQSDDGMTLRAHLLRPSTAGCKALPLVIQALDGRLTNAFAPDGDFSPGFAAQSLVARGFAVLQLPMFIEGHDDMETVGEGATRVRWVDSAIDELQRRGIADSGRVGLVGFSRSGYHAYYAVTHPGRHRIAAAVVFDSITAGYGEYVNSAALGDDSSHYGKQYGGGSFWENKQGWLDAPAFNLDKLETPVLFSATGEDNAWSMMETIGAFRAAGRPFDYVYYPRSSHSLQRPRERETAMRDSIQWLSLWLNGEMPNDASRAARWSRLQREWHSQRASQAAALGSR